jgi:MraZ protein
MGKSQVSVDAKGRVLLPAKYRKLLPDDLVVTKSADEQLASLAIYPPDGFEQWMNSVLEAKGGYSANSRQMADLIEEFYANAEQVTVDTAGRVLLPAALREYAAIDKEIVITGARDHLMLRSPDTWQAQQDRPKPSIFDDAASSVTAP